MNKEKYQIAITSTKEGIKSVTIDAPDFKVDSAEISLLDLKELISFFKKLNNPSIEIRTPQITGPQLEIIFEAGAIAHRILPSEDKK